MPPREIRTVTITSKGQVAIPKEVRARAGFREGQRVVVVAYDDRIELLPLSRFLERFGPALASEPALARDWDGPEDEEAWKDL